MKIKVTRDRMVFNLRETPREKHGDWTGVYTHLAGNKIFYRLDKPSVICYAEKIKEEYIKPNDNIVLSNSLAIENFRAFEDTNPNAKPSEKYKAIGGFHVGPSHGSLKNCEVSKGKKLFNFPSPCWPKEERLIFEDDFFHDKHANGFYIFKSKDGTKWDLHHPVPVLSNFTKCESSMLSSDNMPSIFFDHNIKEYVAYLRCNIKLGVRHVFYTKSKDLINWSKPKLIKKTPSFNFNNENLYFMGAYPLKESNKYIAFSHFFRNEILSADGSQRRYFDKKTLVMTSNDGINWVEAGHIFSQDPESVRESLKSGCVASMSTHLGPPHVVSFEEEPDSYVLYVLEGIRTPHTRLVKYFIDKGEIKK